MGFARFRPRVRIHLRDADPSLEGVLASRYTTAGCYRLHRPRLVESDERAFDLDGAVDVPAANVLFIQRLSGDEK